MDLERYVKIYERDLRRIEEAFELYEATKGSKELDTEMIEETLLEWEEFMEELRGENDEDFDELADEIYEQIEEFQTRLDEYENARANYEEKQALNTASERLGKAGIENYLRHQAEASENSLDMSRYEKAISRFSDNEEQVPEKKKRLELDD